jgi:type IV secretory pathway VirB10-like protein
MSQDHKLAFLNGNVDRRTVSPDRVQPAASPYVLQAGAVIPAALITGLRSDLPGQVTAQVTEDVYDSPTGKILLIPQGARSSASTTPRSPSASRAASSSGTA